MEYELRKITTGILTQEVFDTENLNHCKLFVYLGTKIYNFKQSIEQIAWYLNLPVKVVNYSLSFLLKKGYIYKLDTGYDTCINSNNLKDFYYFPVDIKKLKKLNSFAELKLYKILVKNMEHDYRINIDTIWNFDFYQTIEYSTLEDMIQYLGQIGMIEIFELSDRLVYNLIYDI